MSAPRRAVLVALATGLLLAGCSAPASAPSTSSSPSPRPTVTVTVTATASATATPEPTGLSESQDALPYWTNDAPPTPELTRDADALGVDAMYLNTTASYEAYPLVGTLGSRCLVLIGFDAQYRELALSGIAEIEVILFNRFGATDDQGKLFFDAGAPQAMQGALNTQRSRCI